MKCFGIELQLFVHIQHKIATIFVGFNFERIDQLQVLILHHQDVDYILSDI